MLNHKTILITGGTGSWGQALTHRLLQEDVTEIRILARNENLQFQFNKNCANAKLKMIIGDIKDKKSVLEACKGVDLIFHLAALKHVPICEEQPLEAIKTNIVGTQNIIDAAIMCKVKQVFYASTDKAVDPSNTYGLTKALGEKLILNANTRSMHTHFSCIRSGNVLGSNGSVLPIFMKQLEANAPLTLTDSRMTRFFITMPEAIENFIKIIPLASGGEIFVLKMPTFRIKDLAEVLLSTSADTTSTIQEIGLRPGERLSESLVCDSEQSHVYTINSSLYMILAPETYHHLLSHPTVKPITLAYNSNCDLLSQDEVYHYLNAHGFIPSEQEAL